MNAKQDDITLWKFLPYVHFLWFESHWLDNWWKYQKLLKSRIQLKSKWIGFSCTRHEFFGTIQTYVIWIGTLIILKTLPRHKRHRLHICWMSLFFYFFTNFYQNMALYKISRNIIYKKAWNIMLSKILGNASLQKNYYYNFCLENINTFLAEFWK